MGDAELNQATRNAALPKRSRLPLVLGPISVLAVVAIIALVATGFLADPTEGTFAVRVVNDTSSPATIIQCINDCVGSPGRQDVAAGAVIELSARAGNFTDWWRVDLGGSKAAGCLRLQFPSPEPGHEFRLSNLERCPR